MKLYKFITRCMIVAIIVLSVLIISKSNSKYKEILRNKIFEESIMFSKFRNFYNKYLGGVVSLNKFNKTEEVFNEKISYSDINSYMDGAKLMVNKNYLVPVIKEGIVVYSGEKDNYGNVFIVEDNEGIYNWYGNICNSNIKIYDSLSKGDIIGESCDDYIYLVFSKDNKFLNYNDYIK